MFSRYFTACLGCSKLKQRTPKYIILVATLLLFIGLFFDVNHVPGFRFWRKQGSREVSDDAVVGKKGKGLGRMDSGSVSPLIKRPILPQTPPLVSVEIAPTVLIFADSEKTVHKSTKLKNIFSSLKVNYDFVTWNRLDDYSLAMPRLQDKYGNTRYHTIIFTSHYVYDEMDSYDKKILLDHCLKFKIGIIIFADIMHVNTQTQYHSLRTLPVSVQSGIMTLADLEVTKSTMLRITKADNVLKGLIHGKRHALFHSTHKSYEPVAYVWKINTTNAYKFQYGNPANSDAQIEKAKYYRGVFVMYDKGKYDGIHRVFFGTPATNSWLTQLLFIDALSSMSNNLIGYHLDRLIQVDIDDVFVGQTGNKLTKADVMAIVKAQEYLSSQIPGFRFNLGFSFKKYKNSNDSEERDGDGAFVENASKFRWFCHTYGHIKPHLFSKEEIIADLRMNKALAENYGLPVDRTYSVSPHHSGVYPTHEALYEAWKEIWDIEVTSTEGYPHLYPAWGRKGFVYKGIQVLPRQTCGLFTSTLHEATHPKGADYLYKSSHGGELFWSIINNPVAIFMTHQGNYGFQERLAIHLFTNVTRFIKKWTNINLRAESPVDMAKKYFELFPRNVEPQWGDPCTDLRHQLIWNATEKYCKPKEVSRIPRLPDILIIGPQKTGTTALYTFLSMHPQLEKSRRSNYSFEEIQFFNRNYYMRGLRWYMDFFPEHPKPDDVMYMEKSANYFDSLKTPLRAFNIIPNAKLVIISIDPKLRAYSWYQHIRSKRESVALNHSFYDVISGRNKTQDPKFAVLTQRCLLPGRYAEALQRWLYYFDKSQIYLMDGQELRYRPHIALRRLVEFLGISHFPYHKRIKFSQSKGFHCATSPTGAFRCLGKGKGRRYEAMSNEAYQFLNDYYRVPNLRLADQLTALKKPLPKWLQKEIKERTPS